MNYTGWYTDTMDIRRVQAVQDGSLVRHKRVQVAADIPCRIYQNSAHGPRMQPTAAYMESEEKLACGNSVDVRPGDELIIRRGRGLGKVQQTIRAFAGEPVHYYEPFGAVTPGLAHQELAMLQKEYLDAESEVGTDGAGGRNTEAYGGTGEAPAGGPETAGGNRGVGHPPGG